MKLAKMWKPWWLTDHNCIHARGREGRLSRGLAGAVTGGKRITVMRQRHRVDLCAYYTSKTMK